MSNDQAPAPTTTAALRTQAAQLPDQRIDMFTERGFALAQRIANAYATANAVPACFRKMTVKREKQGQDYVDVEVPNDAALGNCIVAIETAQAVGMSITAVMQNANIIEGKLSWSAQFVIAAVNASRRFTPLRFQTKNLGRIKAKYSEKGTWNKEARKFNMIEREIEVDDTECIAWALPAGTVMPANVVTLDQAKSAGLPVIEGAPVSIKMAVEEGWYAKQGSKWQTSMKSLMLQYRAGAFFGRIHAPDVVMGMGRTSEEAVDELIDVNEPPAAPAPQTTADLRQRRDVSDAEVVEPRAAAETKAAEPVAQQAETVAETAQNETPAADSGTSGDTAQAAQEQPAEQQKSPAREAINAANQSRAEKNAAAADAALAGQDQAAEPTRRAGRRSSGGMSES